MNDFDRHLSINEISTRYIWSIQSNHSHNLADYVQQVFKEKPQSGSVLQQNQWRFILLSPSRGFLMSESLALPQADAAYNTLLTDISHGYREFCLTGGQPFEFAGLYVSVDLNNTIDKKTGSLRCRLGQYACLLWWDDNTNLHILVERSYAQSFGEYLNHLLLRHHWV
ncbi:MAG: hypothetical protein GY806_22985 [Gammaproteobacteria bacterium]|nr:hypothetical protein [Gammaproteobacteria bacterium]